MITNERMTHISKNLVRAAIMSADELAAKKGEDNLFVKIKRNSERLSSCRGHDFEAQPDWRTTSGPLINRTVRCRACGGEMKIGAAHDYLLGYAHGSNKDYKALVEAIWPPGQA